MVCSFFTQLEFHSYTLDCFFLSFSLNLPDLINHHNHDVGDHNMCGGQRAMNLTNWSHLQILSLVPIWLKSRSFFYGLHITSNSIVSTMFNCDILKVIQSTQHFQAREGPAAQARLGLEPKPSIFLR